MPVKEAWSSGSYNSEGDAVTQTTLPAVFDAAGRIETYDNRLTISDFVNW